jgi:hypothetical protein
MMSQRSNSQRRSPTTKITGATILKSDFMMRDTRDVRWEVWGTASALVPD